jgi:hypothetical protein
MLGGYAHILIELSDIEIEGMETKLLKKHNNSITHTGEVEEGRGYFDFDSGGDPRSVG